MFDSQVASLSIQNAKQLAQKRLDSSSPSPDVDAQVLLCHLLDCTPSFLFIHADDLLSETQWQGYQALIARRQKGEPVAYITGQRGFWNLDLKVSTSTLIPRADTELLVEQALSKLKSGMCVIDLGTGTGAIGLSLAKERKDIQVIVSDIRWDAIQLSRQNAQANHLNNVQFVHASWLSAFQSACFDLIVSNPPYIAENDPHLSEGDVLFEPASALVSGKDGLDDLRIIVDQASVCLKKAGWLIVEHGYDQSQAVQSLYQQAGFDAITAYQDLNGHDRTVVGQYKV